MFNSPSDSVVEDIFPSTVDDNFPSNEIIINSPLDELIREVSVSPTEELLESQPNTVDSSSLNPDMDQAKLIDNLCIKRGKQDNNPTKKKMKIMPSEQNVNKFKPKSSTKPYIIKVESSENDLPVISIPEMDFTEPEL